MTMAKRIRAMCRHVMQTYLRNPKTTWLKMSFAFLFDLQSQPAEPPTNQVDYFVGFDYEVFKPWRAKVGSKTKETTDSVKVDIDLCKPMFASWPDGFQSKIADITSEDWLTKTGTVKTLPCQTSLHPWSAIHSVTKERIHISTRKDRRNLYCMFKGKKQILQVPQDASGDPVKTLATFKDLGDRFVKNEIDIEMLKMERNKLFPKQKTMKETTAPAESSTTDQKKIKLKGTSNINHKKLLMDETASYSSLYKKPSSSVIANPSCSSLETFSYNIPMDMFDVAEAAFP